MSAEAVMADLVAALDLPAGAQVDHRVPKKLLTENGAPTAADKRAINDGIEELVWVAALKPNTIGVPVYRDEVREYLEIAVLHLILRAEAKATRIIALTHRAVPYPVLLLAACPNGTIISAAHKRWSQGEAGKTVVDGNIVEANLGAARDNTIARAFCDALALNRQPRLSLYALYQGWIDTLFSFQAACKTGHFAPLESPEAAAARREALAACAQLEAEIARLRAAAAREKQMARQVALNLELKRIEAELASAHGKL
jgi:Domain of unknown function (DUF4391)